MTDLIVYTFLTFQNVETFFYNFYILLLFCTFITTDLQQLTLFLDQLTIFPILYTLSCPVCVSGGRESKFLKVLLTGARLFT